jgi:hypothetical protein
MRLLRNDERIGWTAACDGVARVTFVAILVKRVGVRNGAPPQIARTLCDVKAATGVATTRCYRSRYTRGTRGSRATPRSTAIGPR